MKQLALSTQLKNANNKVRELEAQIVTLQKEIASTKSSSDSWYKQFNEATATIEQIHQVFDAVPNSIPRESEGENSWDRVKRSPVTRIAAWLSIRNFERKEQGNG